MSELTGTCMFCKGTASHETLVSFGARCGPCYGAYVRAPVHDFSKVPDSAVPDKESPHAWAYRLRWRHQQGERLTPYQIEAYQSMFKGARAIE